MPYAAAGQWGYLRVLSPGDRRILPLNGGGSGTKTVGVPDPAAPESLSQGGEVPGPLSMLER